MRELEKETYEANVRVGHRSKHELIYVILKAVETEKKLTPIEKRAGINHTLWERHRFLIDRGYIIEKIEGDRKTYSLGKLGRKYIEWFDSGRKTFDYDSYIFPEGNIKLKETLKEQKSKKSGSVIIKKTEPLEKPKEIPRELTPIRLTVKPPSEEEKMYNDLEEYLRRTMSSLTPNKESDVTRRISNFLKKPWEYPSLTKPSPSDLFWKLGIERVLIEDTFMGIVTYKLRKRPKI